jgi:galactokinase
MRAGHGSVCPVEAAAHAPGRVTLVGDHTDLTEGLCLAFAIARGVTVRGVPSGDGRIFAHATSLGEDDVFAADHPARPGRGDWRALVRGMVAELRVAGYPVHGARLSIDADLPRGAGLASSAALESALALVLLELGGGRIEEPAALARICQRVERGWVGVPTGLLDHLTVLHAREGEAVRLDLRDLGVRRIRLDLGEWQLVTLDSGVRHDGEPAGLQERRAQCERAAELLGLGSLRDARTQDIARLPAPLDRRLRHVITENERVEQAVEALARDDLPALGRLLDASHASLRDDFEVSLPEVDAVADELRAAGAAGARMVGAGFGGSVLALLPPGVRRPPRALRVRPSGAARLLPPR